MKVCGKYVVREPEEKLYESCAMWEGRWLTCARAEEEKGEGSTSHEGCLKMRACKQVMQYKSKRHIHTKIHTKLGQKQNM